ncbi:hypothetical protein W02_19540 [Nitrospira sp. KM1]|uniref:flagellar export protein FliJ n=1 Tax=Nitrospira sp. KM1 TaxID=1936990 RepID=UPI0013A70E17|nr:flagellar FliJ family protein [Nitrospira sp. KM1]BCA54814.1 hypothetical protein W02_19540 [Nitrospira sp. KM1]
MNLGIIKTYRAQMEDRIQFECAELVKSLEAVQAVRTRLEADEERQAQDFLARARQGMTHAEACDHVASMDALASAICRTREREALIHEALRQKRGELLDASRERKKVELLEEREAVELARQADRRAQQAMDEVAGRQHHQRKDVA